MQSLGRITSRERETVSPVIASAAKQSIYPRAEKWIASLALAMTRIGRGVFELDPLPEPVMGLAEGETRWRG